MSLSLYNKQSTLAEMLMEEIPFKIYIASNGALCAVCYDNLDILDNVGYDGFLCFVESPNTGDIYMTRIEKIADRYWTKEIPPCYDSQRVGFEELINTEHIKAYLVEINEKC